VDRDYFWSVKGKNDARRGEKVKKRKSVLYFRSVEERKKRGGDDASVETACLRGEKRNKGKASSLNSFCCKSMRGKGKSELARNWVSVNTRGEGKEKEGVPKTGFQFPIPAYERGKR